MGLGGGGWGKPAKIIAVAVGEVGTVLLCHRPGIVSAPPLPHSTSFPSMGCICMFLMCCRYTVMVEQGWAVVAVRARRALPWGGAFRSRSKTGRMCCPTLSPPPLLPTPPPPPLLHHPIFRSILFPPLCCVFVWLRVSGHPAPSRPRFTRTHWSAVTILRHTTGPRWLIDGPVWTNGRPGLSSFGERGNLGERAVGEVYGVGVHRTPPTQRVHKHTAQAPFRLAL